MAAYNVDLTPDQVRRIKHVIAETGDTMKDYLQNCVESQTAAIEAVLEKRKS